MPVSQEAVWWTKGRFRSLLMDLYVYVCQHFLQIGGYMLDQLIGWEDPCFWTVCKCGQNCRTSEVIEFVCLLAMLDRFPIASFAKQRYHRNYHRSFYESIITSWNRTLKIPRWSDRLVLFRLALVFSMVFFVFRTQYAFRKSRAQTSGAGRDSRQRNGARMFPWSYLGLRNACVDPLQYLKCFRN